VVEVGKKAGPAADFHAAVRHIRHQDRKYGFQGMGGPGRIGDELQRNRQGLPCWRALNQFFQLDDPDVTIREHCLDFQLTSHRLDEAA